MIGSSNDFFNHFLAFFEFLNLFIFFPNFIVASKSELSMGSSEKSSENLKKG